MLGFGRSKYRALESLYQRLQPKLVRRLYFRFGDKELAFEAVQESFARAMIHWQHLKDVDNLDPWLYRVAVNYGLDQLQKTQRFSNYVDPEVHLHSTDLPEEHALLRERQKMLREAIMNLPPVFREALSLFYEDEMTIQEISLYLEVPLGTVKSRLYRARRQLAEDQNLRLVERQNAEDVVT